MNQRINQLLGQAYDQAVPETWTELSSEQLGRVFDKFAELIVRECVKVVDDTMTENQEMNIGLVMASAQIIAHFGVEE